MKLEDIKSKTKDALDYLVQSLESGHSEVLAEYLGAMARFHTYSFGNVMMIARQKPDATNVAGIRAWNSLGRFVKRGEQGILILAPMLYPPLMFLSTSSPGSMISPILRNAPSDISTD